ncbi:MAG: VOC family protein [Vicinamibacterales bacterium]
MAINGLHGLLYTSEPEKLRAMLRDVFRFKSVDAGGGWLIFGMPPAELGVHPLEGENFEAGHRHLMSFMCDDITRTIAELRAKGVNVVGEPKDEGYGITTMLHLPGGCEVMLYEPRHPIAAAIPNAATRRRPKQAATRSRAKRSEPKNKSAKRRPGPRAKKAGRRR